MILSKFNAVAIRVNPSWMKTDMGGKSANLEPQIQAKSLDFSEKLT